MRIHIVKFIAFLLVLCLSMPFFSVVAVAAVVAGHTHVCHDDEKKEACTDVADCCAACPNFNEVKYRFQNTYDNASKFTHSYILSSRVIVTGFGFEYEQSTTLVSLKVRLNN